MPRQKPWIIQERGGHCHIDLDKYASNKWKIKQKGEQKISSNVGRYFDIPKDLVRIKVENQKSYFMRFMRIATLTNPRQTILLTSRYKNKDNVMTLDWHMPLSFDPMMYAVSIGKTRFSLDLVRNSKVFVVNFISKDFEKEVIFCGRKSGKNLDKFQETGLEKEESEKINCLRIKQALAYLECKVVNEIEVGDHILFIAEIVNYGLKDKKKRLFHLFKDQFTTTLD